MPIGRRIWLAMALAAGLAGCKADGFGSLSMLPRRGPSPSSFDVDAFVAEHNRNAQAIQSLQSRPTINVSRGRLYKVSVDGRLALERPTNFKLELETQGLRKADIGSNAEEFWFWVANTDKDEKWIYWCTYRDLESSNLPVTYQPDWIVDAMGLRPITAREAAGIKVGRGPEPGTTLLSFPATRGRGAPYLREMVVSNTDWRIRKVRYFSESPRGLLAEANADHYQEYPAGRSGSSADETCHLPRNLRLIWKREQLVLDVALNEVAVNQFDHAMAADIFVEPEMPGYDRRNLAEMSRGYQPDRRTRTRQTLPPPDPQDDVRLGRPSPMKEDGPVVPKVGHRMPADPAPEAEEPPLPTLDNLVGAPVSRPPNPGVTPTVAWPGAPGRDLAVER